MMENQRQPNWSWAAAASSAGSYFSPGSRYEQCAIANICLGDTSCCNAPDFCDRYGRLDSALRAAQCFGGISAGPESFDDVGKAIDADRPVGVRIGWHGGGAHFVMLTGYDDANTAVTIDDPHYGRSFVRFGAFPNRYRSGGNWTHTYATRGS